MRTPFSRKLSNMNQFNYSKQPIVAFFFGRKGVLTSVHHFVFYCSEFCFFSPKFKFDFCFFNLEPKSIKKTDRNYISVSSENG